MDEKYLVVPNNYSDDSQCILFENEDCFNAILESDKWPQIDRIENSFYQNINFIQDFNGEEVLREFIKGQGFEFSDNYGDTSSLNFVFDSFRRENTNNEKLEKIKAVIALGEIYRHRMNGEWILIKYYLDFNYYWIPAVKVDNNVNLIFDFLDRYFESSQSLETHFRFEWNENPPLSLSNINEFKYMRS